MFSYYCYFKVGCASAIVGNISNANFKRRVSQADLAQRLADVLLSLGSASVAHGYWTAFFRTMQREWHAIDRLRLDKFLLLVRKFVAAAFALLAQHAW
jgi:hypothetical protein